MKQKFHDLNHTIILLLLYKILTFFIANTYIEIQIMEFIVGYDYKKNDISFSELRKEYIEEVDNIGEEDEENLKDDPSHLIVMLEKKEIIGWAIWHESNTREHQPGYPRDTEDAKILEDLANGSYEVIELHELWLKKHHRRKGYGERFFDFFEKFVLERGYDKIVYYAYNDSAINLCRKRGYKERFYEEEELFTFFKLIN